MIEKTISEIEAKIRGTISASDKDKQELLQLLSRLKSEIATAEKQKLAPLKHSVGELQSSVEGFEQSHPKLVQIVNSISNTLSNLGI